VPLRRTPSPGTPIHPTDQTTQTSKSPATRVARPFGLYLNFSVVTDKLSLDGRPGPDAERTLRFAWLDTGLTDTVERRGDHKAVGKPNRLAGHHEGLDGARQAKRARGVGWPGVARNEDAIDQRAELHAADIAESGRGPTHADRVGPQGPGQFEGLEGWHSGPGLPGPGVRTRPITGRVRTSPSIDQGTCTNPQIRPRIATRRALQDRSEHWAQRGSFDHLARSTSEGVQVPSITAALVR
jgi:hypothetical protein